MKTEAIIECLNATAAIGPVTHTRVSEARAELAAIIEEIARKDAALAVVARARDASTMEEALQILIEEGDPVDAALSVEPGKE